MDPRELLEAIPVAWNARDWKTISAMLADDHVLVDHRPASAGRIAGRDQFVDWLRTMTEVLPDATYEFAYIHGCGPNGAVAQWIIRGTNEGGGRVELEGVLALEIRDGVIVRTDQYPVDDADTAVRHLEDGR